jgi:two-component system sensor histidine kinase CpxA
MKPHQSLFARILLWFFLNLVLLAVILFGFFNLQFRLGPQSPFAGSAEDRLPIIGHLLSRELSDAAPAKWNEILERYSAAYRVDFVLLARDGRILAGKTMILPPEVRARAAAMPMGPGRPPPFRGMGGHPRDEMAPPPGPPPPGPFPRSPRFSVRTTNPQQYWVGLHIPVMINPPGLPAPLTLLAKSDSMTGHGMFFDPTPWVVIAVVLILVSVIWWIPLIRGITRPITRMKTATERIARGQFDVRLDEKRADEIGELGRSINDMAARLEGYVKGQKRFLGDVAHELASPIARINLGLGVLEQRVDEAHRPRVADVAQEMQHLSDLVNELLSFSRAEINPAKVNPAPTLLAPIVRRVLERERADGAEIRTAVDEQLAAIADPELLARALANIVRNAVLYAGQAGPIDIAARRERDEVLLEVRDSGPGVPEASLVQLFEPFYRPEASRGRETGGVGLGLAIVKTCVQACRGAVSARNLTPHGFAVTIALRAAD